jgi:DNA polymerase-3 subunit epsilon
MKITRPIIFFDLETTGVNVDADRIVQIACIKIDTDGNQTEKEILINPTIPIPKEASDVHGVTDETVKDAPKFYNVAKAIYAFFEGCDIGGYNSDSYDVPLLMNEFARAGIQFPNWDCALVDVLKHERILRSNKLGDVYKRYTGRDLDGAHNALVDVRATVEILLHQLEGNDEMTPLEIDILCQGDKKRFDIAGRCYLDKDNNVRWAFGKNLNKLVTEDMSYLSWVLNNNFPLETKSKLAKLVAK